jgi:hypothetical protein
MAFIQKIYDSGLNQFVYYTKSVITTTPASLDTKPNHSGLPNLIADTHSVLGETGATFSVKDEGSEITVNTRSLNFTGADVVATASNDEVTVNIVGSGLSGSHAGSHISAALDPIDGDKLDITYSPSTYTRTLESGITTTVNHLTSHLKGINNYLASLPPSGENNTASNLGGGIGWYSTKVGSDLRFKSALAGYGTTLSSGTNENTIALKTTVAVLVDGGTVAIDADLGPHYELTIAGNRVLGNPTNTTPGKTIEILVTQDGTGGNLLAFDSNWVNVGKTYQVAQAPNSPSVIRAVARGVSTKWYYTIEHSEFTETTASTVILNQTAWNPIGKDYASLVRVESNSNSRTISGILAPTQGVNQTAFSIVLTGSFYLGLKHEDLSATAANRLLIPTNTDFTLVPNDLLKFQYDFTTQRWRLA